MDWIKNNPTLTFFLIGSTIFLFHLEVIPVTIMEARNFITTREMVVDGNWLLTTMNGLPRYEKPPLPSWITAIFGMLFGLKNVAALRFPTMFMAIILGYTAYRLSIKLVDNKLDALTNALVLITSFYIIGITIEAPWDIYTHGFMLIAIYFMYLVFTTVTAKWRNSIFAGIFIGLSILSKGPISFYGLLLPFLLAFWASYKYKYFAKDKKRVPVFLMVIIAIIVGMWWFLYVRLADPDTFLAITKKETVNWSSYNIRPFYYYWSFFVQSGLWTIPAFVSLLYPYLKNRVKYKQAYKLTFLWTVFSVILLSIIPEKKSRYLVPVLIPLALNTGIYLSYIFNDFKTKLSATEKFPIYLHFIVVGVICIAFPILAYFILNGNIDHLLGYYIASSLAIISVGILLFVFLRKQQLFHCFLLSIGLIAIIKLSVLPLVGGMEKNTAYNSISNLRSSVLVKGTPIYSFGEISPEMLWDYGSSIPNLKEGTTIKTPETETFLVLVVPDEENEFKHNFDHGYFYELKEKFDLNPNASPNSRKYKNRLTNNLYIVKKQ